MNDADIRALTRAVQSHEQTMKKHVQVMSGLNSNLSEFIRLIKEEIEKETNATS